MTSDDALTAGQLADEHETLLLPELAELLSSTSPVEDSLFKLAAVAAHAVTPPASCGITLRQDGRPMTVSSSDDLAAAVDEIQYGHDEGPCLQALATGVVVNVPDLGEESRWDGYRRQALAHGVRSSLSLPLSAHGQLVGALNLYAATAGAFSDADQVTEASAVAGQVEAVLGVVLRLAELVELTEQLRSALEGRSVIDQALGVLMGQQRCSAAEAFNLLRQASQHRNIKLRVLAAEIVTNLSGRAPEPHRFTEPTRAPRTKMSLAEPSAASGPV